MISHRNVMCNQRMLQQAFGTSEDSVVVSWLPHFHDMGLVGVIQRAIYVGMSASADGADRVYTQTSSMAPGHFEISSID